MIRHVLNKAKSLSPDKIIIVEGGHRLISAAISDPAVTYVVQSEPLGTANAISHAAGQLIPESDTLVLLGDSPLVDMTAVGKAAREHQDTGAAMTILATTTDRPLPFTELIRDDANQVIALRKAPMDDVLRELSAGPLVFNTDILLSQLDIVEPIDGEYRLEPLVERLASDGHLVHATQARFVDGIWGINTPEDLAEAERLFTLE
jgi:bifunctional N-acetylglucosamine-1-phosphate-uridyltransferase/glucosamine-1-phosphate-acetyltransferase GlmU-like protein